MKYLKFGMKVSSVTSAISEGDIFIYSCSAQLISFDVDSISKEINCAEHEYMNMSPSLIALAPPLMKVPLYLQAAIVVNVDISTAGCVRTVFK